jgi:hypothetical protein
MILFLQAGNSAEHDAADARESIGVANRELAEFGFFYGRAGTGGLGPLTRIIITSVQIGLLGTPGEPQ